MSSSSTPTKDALYKVTKNVHHMCEGTTNLNQSPSATWKESVIITGLSPQKM